MKGKEHPDTFAELEKMFKSDSDCYDYLNEFVFRFNRRTSRSRGLLFHRLAGLAMATEPNPRSSIIGGDAQDVV